MSWIVFSENSFVHLPSLVRLNRVRTDMDLDANQWRAMSRKDNSAAVVQLIELFYDRIYAFLRRLAGNDADAADLTQRTFARVQQALPTFAGRSSISSWIHGIAYHLYVDWRRAASRVESRPD